MNPLARYTRWLHTRWPAGTVEPLPEARHDGSTSVPGVYVVGDLTGIPLLKFSLDTGARAVERVAADLGGEPPCGCHPQGGLDPKRSFCHEYGDSCEYDEPNALWPGR